MRTKGFTLIEVIIIIVLLGIAIPPLLLAISQGTKDSYRSELTTVASHLAQGQMERVTRVKFLNHSGFRNMTSTKFPTQTINVNGANYTVYTNFSTLVSKARKKAKVKVAGPGIPDVSLITWFTNYSTLKK